MRFQTHCPVGYVNNVTLFYGNLYYTTVPVASFGLFFFLLLSFKNIQGPEKNDLVLFTSKMCRFLPCGTHRELDGVIIIAHLICFYK